ncbi:MAG: lipopolysaccharide assembly protein LapA domain-containing protein [Isosphaeraceae bacterium]
MAYQYKRRRPSIIRNFWVYRRLIGTAILLGLMLWFIWANGEKVTVAFPFGLGNLTSTTGIVILLSALVGSVVTILATTVVFALRRLRTTPAPQEPPSPSEPPPDLPPPNYAAKTTEGFPNAHWSD